MDPVAYSFAGPSEKKEMQLNARRHAGCGCGCGCGEMIMDAIQQVK